MTDGQIHAATEVFEQYNLTKEQLQAVWSALPEAIKARAIIRRSLSMRLQIGTDAYHAAHQLAADQIGV